MKLDQNGVGQFRDENDLIIDDYWNDEQFDPTLDLKNQLINL
jgi:hypothetical protein